jgi:hypothetical protein
VVRQPGQAIRLAAVLGLRRSDFALWVAWVGAGMLGSMFGVAPELRALGVPFGYELGSTGSEVSLVLATSIGLAIFQFAVLRAGTSSTTSSAIIWMAITILVSVAEYVATSIWVSSPVLTSAVAPLVMQMAVPFVFAVIGGCALGVVLWRILHVRSALYVWPAAWVVALAVSYAAFVWGPLLPLLNRLPLLAELLIGDGLNGALYGAITGVALVALVALARRSTKLAPRGPLKGQEQAP